VKKGGKVSRKGNKSRPQYMHLYLSTSADPFAFSIGNIGNFVNQQQSSTRLILFESFKS